MANIDITLLTNKRSRQSVDGLDTIVATQQGGYSVIEGEDSTTTIRVHYPETYRGQTGYVYMKNARGEYAVEEFGAIPEYKDFTLPASMTYVGNTVLVFYAATGSGSSIIRTVWAPVIVPVLATSVDYSRVAVADEDILEEVILKSNAAIAKATAVEEAAAAGSFDGKSVWIRYSANADGSNMTTTWTEGQRYIGVYLGKTASTNPAAYTWSCFVGNTSVSEDTSTTVINYTAYDNTDKSFKASNITAVQIFIPTEVAHGYCAGVNVKNGATPPAYNFVGVNAYPLKLIRYGSAVNSYTAKANTTTNLVFYCDGVNVYIYIQEV